MLSCFSSIQYLMILTIIADDMNGKSMSMLDDEDEPMSMLDDEESEEAVMEKMDHESAEHAHDSSLMHRNGHISLFGEIVHDEEAIISDSLLPPPVREQTQQNVRKYFVAYIRDILRELTITSMMYQSIFNNKFLSKLGK